MKIGLNVFGLLLVAIGGVWMLQGLNILGGSFMSGESQWFVIGCACAVCGLGLLAWTNFVRR